MDKTRRQALAGAVAIVAAGVGAAAAQAPGGGGRGNRGAGGGQQGGPQGFERPSGPAAANVADFARSQVYELEDELRLTPAQRAAWNAYADKVLRLADDVARHRNDVRFPRGSAPEQLDFLAQTVRDRLTAIEDIDDAGKALYAVLAPDQREKVDNRLARIPLPLVVPIAVVAEPGRDGRRGGGPAGGAPGGPGPGGGAGPGGAPGG